MTARALPWSRPRLVEDRHRQVTARLAGLADRSRFGGPAAANERAAALGGALGELGGGFAAFGAYLGTRFDLLRPDICFIFRDAAVFSPLSDLRIAELLAVEWGREPAAVEPAPLCRGASWQVQRVQSPLGEALLVELLDGEAVSAIDRDMPLLRLVEPVIGALDVPAQLTELVEDFARVQRRERGFLAHAQPPRMDPGRKDGPAPLPLLPELSGGRVLAFADPGGESLASRPAPPEILRRIAQWWLHQALFAGEIRTRVELGEWLLLSDGSFTVLPVPSVQPAAAIQEDLWLYLLAAGAADPAAALPPLLRLTDRAQGALPTEQLLLQLRQAVPFRSSVGDERLNEQVALQWRVARAAGYLLRPHVVDFAAGFAGLSATCRADRGDPIGEALAELRLEVGFGRIREALDAQRLLDQLAPFAALAVTLPQKLDEAVDRLSRGEIRVRLESGEGERRRPADSGLIVALLVGFVAVALLTERDGGQALALSPVVATVVVLVLGILLIVLTGRGR
jgi:hypothetical protein